LRFTNEGRKVEAAKKHFVALGLDYRAVDDKNPLWHEPEYMRGIREPRLPYKDD